MVELQSASAAAHGAPAQDGVVVRPAAAGAHRRAHDRLLGVRPVRRPAPHAGRHRPGDDKDLCARYDYRDPNASDPNKCASPCDETGAFWIDYVADVGDGFESTYTIAYLLAQDSLDVRGAGQLRHGEVLIMGGDQCYPQATREEYKKRLLQPFNWAFTVANPDRKLFAIPGNHDWYDGLNAFDSLFCSSRDKLSNAKGNVIGGWQCQQHRSYWAIRLPYNWWIWGADIQFSKYLDAAQVNYFETRGRADGAAGQPHHLPGRAVLAAGRPAGRRTRRRTSSRSPPSPRKRGARVVAVIAGDWHHYNRYYAHELDVHFITSGGGGAFLHPTHVLQERHLGALARAPGRGRTSRVAGCDRRAPRRGLEGAATTTSASSATPRPPRASSSRPCRTCRTPSSRCSAKRSACASASRSSRRRPSAIPSKGRSYLLSLGNVLFPFYNPGFAIGIGLLYWLITWEFQNARHAVRHLRRQDRRPRHQHVARGACCRTCRSISSRP